MSATLDNAARPTLNGSNARALCVEFCREIGCSMISPKTCPGDPGCAIVRKVIPAEILKVAAIREGSHD